MPVVTSHPEGSFCWIELSTTDQEKAKSFYTKLFEWSVNEFPVSEGEVYSMVQLQGSDVGAICRLRKGQLERGVPPNWLSYVSVANADETAARVTKLGGQVLAEPFDVFDAGRMAVMQDPGGAVLSLWQPRKHIGVQVTGEFGTCCWQELLTNDVQAARTFYTSLFGWTTKADDTEYTEFVLGKNSFAGMMKIRPEWGPMPPHWGIYFLVEKCDAAVEKAKGLGARICVPPMDIEKVGRFSTLQDPQGAAFSVIHLFAAAH